MAHAAGMASVSSMSIAVIDYRRRSMVLKWHASGGTWTACEELPALVHGIAWIQPSQPNICVYGQAGRLLLQIGPDQYALAENSPRIKCVADWRSLGFRRRFIVESSTGGVLFSHSYWPHRTADFLLWLATKAEDPDWRAACGRQWSEGVTSAVLRSA
jgi:hypothetical protein